MILLYDLIQVALAVFVAYLIIRDTLHKPSPEPETPTKHHTGYRLGKRIVAGIEQGLQQAPSAPSIPLCRTEQGIHWLSLAGGHWGIFGSSGSGKGNALQLISLSLLQQGSHNVELMILDPKAGLDYSWADKIAHSSLYSGDKLDEGFIQAVIQMNRRNNLLREQDCRNIREYNSRYPARALPYLCIVADEVAELSKDSKALLAKLARMGRAAGVVLFISTQYPTAEVLSSQVQANVLNRLVLRLSGKRYTEVALGRGYGEKAELEPAEFDKPGIAVLKTEGGREQQVIIPELTESRRDELVQELIEVYPRFTEDDTPDTPVTYSLPFSEPTAPSLIDCTPNPENGLQRLTGDNSMIYDEVPTEFTREQFDSLLARPRKPNPNMECISTMPLCSKCGKGPEVGAMRKTPRGGRMIHRHCWSKS